MPQALKQTVENRTLGRNSKGMWIPDDQYCHAALGILLEETPLRYSSKARVVSLSRLVVSHQVR